MPRVVTLDVNASTLTTSGFAIADDGVEVANVTAVLVNTDGNPMAGLSVDELSLASDGTGNTLTPIGTATDRNGEFEWTLASTVAATKTLTLTALGAELADNPTVVVQADTTWEANLPAGFTEKFDTEFGNILNGGTNADTINCDFTSGAGPSGGLRTDVNQTDLASSFPPDIYTYSYPGNNAGNGVGAVGGTLNSLPEMTAAQQIYSCFDIWLSADYVVHTNEEKTFYPIRQSSLGQGASDLVLMPPSGSGSAAGPDAAVGINVQSNFGAAQFFIQSSGPYIAKGEWNRVEVLMKMNSAASTTDGVVQVWVNGTQVINRSDICWGGTGSSPFWKRYRMASTRGGGVSSVLTPAGGQTRKFSRWSCHYKDSL